MFVANLEPRTIRGLESEGMIVAVSTPEGKFSVLSPSEDIPVGTSAK
jgi:tRNA-binding EMAP/Myf-like protein